MYCTPTITTKKKKKHGFGSLSLASPPSDKWPLTSGTQGPICYPSLFHKSYCLSLEEVYRQRKALHICTKTHEHIRHRPDTWATITCKQHSSKHTTVKDISSEQLEHLCSISLWEYPVKSSAWQCTSPALQKWCLLQWEVTLGPRPAGHPPSVEVTQLEHGSPSRAALS